MADETKPYHSPEYSGSHTAPTPDSGSPMHDVTENTYPDDFYSSNGFRYYGSGDNNIDRESYYKIVDAKARPYSKVDIYRAVPKNIKSINQGDWVTINRKYAKDHGESTLLGDYKILKKTVRARDLHTNGDSFHEWGYWPKEIPVKFSDRLDETNKVREKFGMAQKPRIYSTESSKASGGPVEDQDIASPAPAEDEGITTYHGSPYEFERFDISKIGTGEGAQAYGHGLYLAEYEKIAKSYRDALANGFLIDNKPFQATRVATNASVGNYASDALKRFDGNKNEAIKWLKDGNSQYDTEAAKMLKKAKSIEPWKGHMYEVKIKAHPDHFLDWDKSIDQQSDYVKKCLGIGLEEIKKTKNDTGQIDKSKLPIIYSDGENFVYAYPADRGNGFHISSSGIMNNYFPMGPQNFAKTEEQADSIAQSWIKASHASGKNLHENFLNNMKDYIQNLSNIENYPRNSFKNFKSPAEEVSQYYKDRGLKGIKYLDAASRSSGTGPFAYFRGTHNYVVFDDKLLEIKRRYEMGGAVPMASGGEVEDTQSMPNQLTSEQQSLLDQLSRAIDRVYPAMDAAEARQPVIRDEPTMPGEPALTREQHQEYNIGQLQNALARIPIDYPANPAGYAKGGRTIKKVKIKKLNRANGKLSPFNSSMVSRALMLTSKKA